MNRYSAAHQYTISIIEAYHVTIHVHGRGTRQMQMSLALELIQSGEIPGGLGGPEDVSKRNVR